MLRRSGERRGTPADFVVVGLGNPGTEYARTRHNVGAEVVELLARRHRATLRKGKERALVDEVGIEGKRVAIHCFEARSRTSAVAVLYSTRELGIPLDATVADVAGALPDWEPAPFLRDAMTRLTVSRAEARRG